MADLPETLLDVVQSVMHDSGGHVPQDISTQPEARRAARIARESFYYLLDELDWPHQTKYGQLDSVADSSRPTHLLLNDNSHTTIHRLKYDTSEGSEDANHKDLIYLYPEDFLDIMQRRSSMGDVDEVSLDTGVKIYVRNDIGPDYWTAFDDKYIILDAYNSYEETTVQGLKTTAELRFLPEWKEQDDFVVPVPKRDMATYLAYTKSVFAAKVRLEENVVDTQQARTQIARSRFKEGIADSEERPRRKKFGRRGLYSFAAQGRHRRTR